jgi:hypothetical protein
MSSKKMGELNNLFGKKHSEESKELMRQKALGRIHSEETKLLMSTKRGSFVNILERCDKEGFKLIGSFVSARRAGKFLGISGSTVVRYMKSGEIFKVSCATGGWIRNVLRKRSSININFLPNRIITSSCLLIFYQRGARKLGLRHK